MPIRSVSVQSGTGVAHHDASCCMRFVSYFTRLSALFCLHKSAGASWFLGRGPLGVFRLSVPAYSTVAFPFILAVRLCVAVSGNAPRSSFPPPHARCAPPLSSVLVSGRMRRFVRRNSYFFWFSFLATCALTPFISRFRRKKQDMLENIMVDLD